MSSGRRKNRLEDSSSWVFNRLAGVYDARPPYPTGLVEALAGVVSPGARVGDWGAGIGHLALPLAERGLRVVAVEPARAMLDRLQVAARSQELAVEAVHAAAEATPLASASLELVVVAEALHFLDPELASREISRVLVPAGTLAIVTCEFADTPFMRGVAGLLAEATVRRRREPGHIMTQFFATVGSVPEPVLEFEDHTRVEPAQLERIVRSISFFGGGMPEPRLLALVQRMVMLSPQREWSRRFNLHLGKRRSG